MEKIQLPEITTEIQAEPWAEGHVAHFITTRAVSQKSKPKRVITANILPQWMSFPSGCPQKALYWTDVIIFKTSIVAPKANRKIYTLTSLIIQKLSELNQ